MPKIRPRQKELSYLASLPESMHASVVELSTPEDLELLREAILASFDEDTTAVSEREMQRRRIAEVRARERDLEIPLPKNIPQRPRC